MKLCGATITRCSTCRKAVAPSRLRQGLGCPSHPDADTTPGTCAKSVRNEMTSCRLHGALAPQVEQATEERRLEAGVAKLLADRELTPVDNPLAALRDLIAECLAVKDSFRDRVDKLRSLTVEDQIGRQDVAALLAAYERALDRAGRLLVDAAKLNLDERLVRIDERSMAMQLELVRKLIMPLFTVVPKELGDIQRRALAERLRAHEAGERLPPPPDAPRYVKWEPPPPDPEPAPVPSALAELEPAPEHDFPLDDVLPTEAEVTVEPPAPPPQPSVVRAYPPVTGGTSGTLV